MRLAAKVYRRFLLGIALLLVLDSAVAYGFSPQMTQKILAVFSNYAQAPVLLESVRFHPLFFACSAENLEVFDPDNPKVRVIFSRRVWAQVDFLDAVFHKKFNLSALVLKGAELKTVKDSQGVLNLEKILRPKGQWVPKGFHGWKHKDWLINFYGRLKYEVKQSAGRSSKEPVFFRIGALKIQGARLILTDRQTKPLIFHDIQLLILGLEWRRSGPSAKTIVLKGLFKAGREGYFNLHFFREDKQIRLMAQLSQFDLEALKPLYKNTSPVYFDRGFATLWSLTHLTPETLKSKNSLRIEGHLIKAAAGWSPESRAVVQALNLHSRLNLDFVITGSPDFPLFEDLERSLLRIVEKNFGASRMIRIRKRMRQELDRLSDKMNKI